MSSVANHGVAKAARSLHSAEITADTHLEASANLLASLARGRTAAGLPFGAVQGAIDEAGEAVAHSLLSRRHLGRAHERLLATVKAHDIDITDHGDIFPWCVKAAGAADEGSVRAA